MMRPQSPFGKASEFFGAAFNDMERASDMQERIQGTGIRDARYGADYDTSSMQGAVPPQSGPYGEDQGPADDLENLKRDLLSAARERRRPSDGSLVIRAGGGYNPAVKS
jgi:hypothetical protein